MAESRAYIYQADSFGHRAADRIAKSMGSWTFIIAQTIFVAAWIILNLVAIFRHWDAYPFILLNLLFSTQAAYAAPVIMMSQNRQAQKDHLRDDHEAAEVDLLFQINRQQLEILTLLHDKLCPDAPLELGKEIKDVQRKAANLEEKATEAENKLGLDVT
ncbi:MAG: DUF1003 domain-containing protein [Chloroflexota bacterium]